LPGRIEMNKKRPIIEIDEDLCDGCGNCVIACAESALEIVDGKAKLVGEIYCDGLGACLGDCPTGALKVVEREAEDFDEAAVEELIKSKESKEAEPPPMACGCPGSMTRTIERDGSKAGAPAGTARSELRQWPLKLQLLGPDAPFLKGADLLLLADCAAVCDPNLHGAFLKDYAIATGCPKLDDLDAHVERLAEIIKGARPRSLTVLYAQVPCCRGFVWAAEKAIERSGVDIPLKRIMLGMEGEVLEEEELLVKAGCANCAC